MKNLHSLKTILLFCLSPIVSVGLFGQKTYVPPSNTVPYFYNATATVYGALETTAATIYVNQNAAGANDGSSWDNAFIHLQDALNMAQDGDNIWVAKGTYKPATAGGSDTSSFIVNTDVLLYGGFAGDETTVIERDPELNPTILSGDLMGDDLQGMLDTNRTDNAMTVMIINEEVSPDAIIDGFTIQGGHADGQPSTFFYERGGGIFCFGAPKIQNCIFSGNYANPDGGALYYQGPATNEAILKDCFFEGNEAEDDGGAVVVAFTNQEGISIENCDFSANRAERRGGAMMLLNANAFIKDCIFSNNTCLRSGGAIANECDIDNLKMTLRTCTFESNQARDGGALISRAAEFKNQQEVIGCIFNNNQALDLGPNGARRGGAIRAQFFQQSNDSEMLIDFCFFDNNSSEGSAGAIYGEMVGQNAGLTVKNSQFSQNTANTGGGMYIRGSSVGNSNVLIDSTLFQFNKAFNFGGGLVIGDIQGSETFYTISHSAFFENLSQGQGGGMYTFCEDDARTILQMDNNVFQENSAETSGGAAQIVVNNNKLTHGSFQDTYRANSSPNGAVLNALNTTSLVGSITNAIYQNCLFHENASEGAVISADTFSGLIVRNCTMADNIADGIHVGVNSHFRLQNSIFKTEADRSNLVFAPGWVNFKTFGGNLFSDSSMMAYDTPSDLLGTDPLFEMNSFRLQETSPAVDAGIDYGNAVPDFDIEGNDRIQGGCIDIGAYESPFDNGQDCVVFTNIENVLATYDVLGLFPNPNHGHSVLKLKNHWTGEVQATFINTLGQVIHTEFFPKNTQEVNWEIHCQSWQSGVYRVILQNEQEYLFLNMIKG